MIDIEQSYQRYLKLTGDPGAAATLVLAEATAKQPHKDALTPKQAAERLGVSTDTIYELCKNGKLTHQKVGRAVRIRPADLDNFNDDTTKKPMPGFRHLKF